MIWIICGIVYLALVAVVVACCVVAGRADEAMGLK